MFVSRRAVMCGFASMLGTLAEVASAAPGSVSTQSDSVWQRLPLGVDTWSQRGALGCVPRRLLALPAAERPLVVLLHGYGQAKNSERALRAWRDEYGLERAYERLNRPPLRPHFDGAGMLTELRQAELNEALARRPFLGAAAACPSTPIAYPVDRVGPKFAAWVESELLVAARQSLDTTTRREATALGGVSMGGLLALEVALELPHEFGAVLGMQSQLDPERAVSYAERFDQQAQRGTPIHVLVLTSEGDVYRSANERFHSELVRRGLPSDFCITPGAHTAGWVYEVGALEALMWLDDRFRPSPVAGAAVASR